MKETNLDPATLLNKYDKHLGKARFKVGDMVYVSYIHRANDIKFKQRLFTGGYDGSGDKTFKKENLGVLVKIEKKYIRKISYYMYRYHVMLLYADVKNKIQIYDGQRYLKEPDSFETLNKWRQIKKKREMDKKERLTKDMNSAMIRMEGT